MLKINYSAMLCLIFVVEDKNVFYFKKLYTNLGGPGPVYFRGCYSEIKITLCSFETRNITTQSPESRETLRAQSWAGHSTANCQWEVRILLILRE